MLRRNFLKLGAAAAAAGAVSFAGNQRAKADSISSLNDQIEGNPQASNEQTTTEKFGSNDVRISEVRYKTNPDAPFSSRKALVLDLEKLIGSEGFSGKIEIFGYKMAPATYLNGEPQGDPMPLYVNKIGELTQNSLSQDLLQFNGGTVEEKQKDDSYVQSSKGTVIYPITNFVRTGQKDDPAYNEHNIDPRYLVDHRYLNGEVAVVVTKELRVSYPKFDLNDGLTIKEELVPQEQSMILINAAGAWDIPTEEIPEQYHALKVGETLNPWQDEFPQQVQIPKN